MEVLYRSLLLKTTRTLELYTKSLVFGGVARHRKATKYEKDYALKVPLAICLFYHPFKFPLWLLEVPKMS